MASGSIYIAHPLRNRQFFHAKPDSETFVSSETLSPVYAQTPPLSLSFQKQGHSPHRFGLLIVALHFIDLSIIDLKSNQRVDPTPANAQIYAKHQDRRRSHRVLGAILS